MSDFFTNSLTPRPPLRRSLTPPLSEGEGDRTVCLLPSNARVVLFFSSLFFITKFFLNTLHTSVIIVLSSIKFRLGKENSPDTPLLRRGGGGEAGWGVVLLLLFFSYSSFASNISIITRLDTNEILIGDWVKYSVEIVRDNETQIVFPDLGNALKVDSVREIEILAFTFDTLLQSGMKKEIRTYTITAFDSGYYIIPPIQFYTKTQEDDMLAPHLTEAMLLTVKSIEVDTTDTFKPIKAPLTMPFSMMEIITELLIGAGILVLLAAIILYRVFRKKKPIIMKRFVRKQPAHEIALEKLRVLEDKKLWQKGEVKTYYSELSEAMREYIELRYNIPALESTTKEIMTRIGITGITQKQREDLQRMLQTADLVKFAKYAPMPDEHAKAMTTAYDLVNATKTDEQAHNEIIEEKT